jgi:hypothetical protein
MRLVILLLLFAGMSCAQNTTSVPSTTVKPDDSGRNYMRTLYILVGVSGTLLFALTIVCLCARRRERRSVRDVIPASQQFANPVFSDPTEPAYGPAYGPSSPIYPYLSSSLPFSYAGDTGLYPRYESDSSGGQ